MPTCRVINRTLILTVAATVACREAPPSGAPTTALENRDIANLGLADSVLVWNESEKIAGYRNFDMLHPTRPIHAGDAPYPLPERLIDLSHVRYAVEGDTFDIDDYVEHNRVAGLLVIQRGEILHEQYSLGNTEESLWVSFSIAKSVSSLLMGAAIQDGFIETIDDDITELMPVFEGTSYDGVSIRDVLHMASGVSWNEDYADPESDISKSIPLTLEQTYDYMGALPRVGAPGAVFNYNTAETHVVGGVIRAATGRSLAEYLTEKIWRPFGMESEANWRLVADGGPEYAGCCISATLRDYGRIGIFAMHDGVLPDGTRVLPESWMEDSTTPSEGSDGYGYLWWLRGGERFGAYGIFGQAIYIDPVAEVIVVTQSVWPDAVGGPWQAHRASFFTAMSEALSFATVG